MKPRRALRQGDGNVIGVDVCSDLGATSYGLATIDDLSETARLVKVARGQMMALTADVRDASSLREAVKAGMNRFDRLDVVVGNAASAGNGSLTALGRRRVAERYRRQPDRSPEQRSATVEHLRAPTGSIVLTNSTAGPKSRP